MTPLPDSHDAYPSPLHLPFNRSRLECQFCFAAPDQDPGGEGVWLLLRGNDLLLAEEAGALHLYRGPLPLSLATDAEPPLYVGRWRGEPCRLLDVTGREPPAGSAAENILAARSRLGIELLSLAGLGSQILHWRRTSRYCSLCGGETQPLPGEWGMLCRGCGYAHYPHIHPCVIVLVRRPGEVLLTRKAGWAPGRYSLVAGFLDPGECLEEAVAREVLEETGVRVTDIRYVGSQCWPFPSQLMTGFVADYAGGEVVVEEKELEDARWFPLAELPLLPPRRSIARWLLDRYAAAPP